ncbi:FMN-dependent NADH-azoreductase [Novosphingobium resinovorum]
MKLLHLDSSILGDNSASRAISAAIVSSLTTADPSLEVTYRDLAAEPLAHLTLDVLGNPEGTPELAQFLDADVVVIGAGFYNFSIPSQLKAWIDRIAIAARPFATPPKARRPRRRQEDLRRARPRRLLR